MEIGRSMMKDFMHALCCPDVLEKLIRKHQRGSVQVTTRSVNSSSDCWLEVPTIDQAIDCDGISHASTSTDGGSDTA